MSNDDTTPIHTLRRWHNAHDGLSDGLEDDPDVETECESDDVGRAIAFVVGETEANERLRAHGKGDSVEQHHVEAVEDKIDDLRVCATDEFDALFGEVVGYIRALAYDREFERLDDVERACLLLSDDGADEYLEEQYDLDSILERLPSLDDLERVDDPERWEHGIEWNTSTLESGSK